MAKKKKRAKTPEKAWVRTVEIKEMKTTKKGESINKFGPQLTLTFHGGGGDAVKVFGAADFDDQTEMGYDQIGSDAKVSSLKVEAYYELWNFDPSKPTKSTQNGKSSTNGLYYKKGKIIANIHWEVTD